jgi:hypothetical protein
MYVKFVLLMLMFRFLFFSFFCSGVPTDDLGVVGGGSRLLWNTSEGAVLHLPNGATRLTCIPGLFKQHAIQHGANWYKFANNTRHCDIRNGSLCLVTGTDKTNAWMVGAFSQASAGSQLLCLRTTTVVPGAVPYSYAWVASNPAMRRSRPCADTAAGTAVDLADLQRDDSIFQCDAPDGQNHCVFVRGFRISLQQSLWAYVMGYALDSEISPINDSKPEDLVGGGKFSFGGVRRSFFSGWSGSGGGSGGRSVATHKPSLSTKHSNKEATVEYMPEAAIVSVS